MRNKSIEDGKNPKLIGSTWRKYPTETSKQKATYGLFECQYCKKEFEARTTHIKSGNTKSCGCLSGEKHGLHQNKFYKTWYNMRDRCTNPKIKAYKDYGGRGITVCEEWLDVVNFVDWAEKTYPNIEGYTLDRIDNDKGYSPENCRWVDKSTQVINQRIRRTNTSGYVGINWVESKLKWVSRINVEKKRIWLGDYKTIEEAILARDNYITQNNLQYKLSTDYVKEKK